MKHLLQSFYLCILMGIMACNNPYANIDSPRERISFDNDWLFMLTDNNGLENPAYDDSEWRNLDLPHDWAIEAEIAISAQ